MLIDRFIPTGMGSPKSTNSTGVARIGSSPQAWGKAFSKRRHTGKLWFIPTGVGNIVPMIADICRSTVHPHGRGENGIEAHNAQFEYGSSPRAWGKLLTQTGLFKDVRLIPTGVGKLDVAPFAALQDRSIPTSVGNMVSVPTVQSGPLVHPHGHGEVLTVLYFKEHQLAFAGQSNHTSFSARGANSRDSKSRGMSG